MSGKFMVNFNLNQSLSRVFLMIDQIDQMLHDWLHISNVIVFFAGLFSIFLVLILINGMRRRTAESYLSVDSKSKLTLGATPTVESVSETHDTLFILPDISGYTRFMAGKHFTSKTAQFIVFSLINAMIKASNKTLTLSKIDGDAVLLFVDAERHSKQKIGETLVDIFNAFCAEKAHLMSEQLCSCKSCQHIKTLDLKIIVHRGNLSRFEFRGSVDHFGHDLIVLYRIVKNKIAHRRYILITDAASNLVELPDIECSSHIDLQIDDIGHIGANRFDPTDQVIEKWKTQALKNKSYGKMRHWLELFTQISKRISFNFQLWMHGSGQFDFLNTKSKRETG